MNIFSISDLHLSGLADKPMNIFGAAWENHFEKIKKDWVENVRREDAVLICGDTSWGTDLEEGLFDVRSLSSLPGKKILIRGNHDYWWNGITKIRSAAPDETFFFLQNDCVKFDNVVVCGSRGWTCPGSADYTDDDEKIYKREAERFKLCFKEVEKVRESGDKLLVMIHFPPFSLKSRKTYFTEMFDEMKVDKVIFGHIHGSAFFPQKTTINETEYILTSCDKVDFRLQRIL